MDATLTLRPIGFIRTGDTATKFHALHQPNEGEAALNVLELVPEPQLKAALKDLEGFSRIWLIWWFHKNTTWRAEVLPPRGPEVRRGVFATRSPYRPNPIAMTPVKLLGIDGYKLLLGPIDAIDGTPVFDIRPYVPAYDAFPEERAGWIGEVDALYDAPPPFRVAYDDLARTQCAWLRDAHDIDFHARLEELLSRDPSPHRTRRIKRLQSGQMRIDCGAWRAYFAVHETKVVIERLSPGYPRRHLEAGEQVPDLDAQRAFLARWPSDD